MDRIGMKRINISNRKKGAVYLVFLIGLVAMYATYIPYFMDYYIVRPEGSFSSFFMDNITKSPYIFEGVVIGLAFAVIYCLTLRAGVSTLVVSALLFILTHASYLKYINRRELLRLGDLLLTEAAGMALGYFKFELNRWLVILAGVFMLFSVAGVALEVFRKGWKMCDAGGKAGKESDAVAETKQQSGDDLDVTVVTCSHYNRRFAVCTRLLGAVCLCAALFIYMDYFLRDGNMADEIEPISSRNDIYVLYRFLQNDRLSMVSEERVAERYEFLLSQEPAKEVVDRENYPNVIVIMNESWWDTDNIQSDRITFSQDPMGPYKALADGCITGYQTSNVFGGGTLASEMEFLTGLNTKYFRADSAYAQMQGRRLPSLADYFNGLDYETVAIHPYYGTFYDRDVVYEAMGFDKSVFAEDMRYQDIYTYYISDESLAKEIIAEMEDGSGGPEFIWAISMANHMRALDYMAEPEEDYDYPIGLELVGAELDAEDYDALVNYVNGIYLANQAFSQLVDYFTETDQPTVLVMFGDHCPYFSDEVLEVLGLGDESDRGTEERLYSTPVIVWSNFAGEELSFSGESMYYLPQTLIDYAGLPDSDMTRILRYVRSSFKTNSLRFVRDASGEELHRCTDRQLQALSHFKAVQYDILFGEGVCRDVWKPAGSGKR